MLARQQKETGGAVEYSWLLTSSNEETWCQLSSSSLFDLVNHVRIEIRELFNKMVYFSQHLPVELEEPENVGCKVNNFNSTSDVFSDFVLQQLCIAANIDVCRHLIFSSSSSVICEDKISKMLLFAYGKCNFARSKRSIFSGLDEDNVVRNIDTNIENIRITNQNVHELDDRINKLFEINKEIVGQNDEKTKNLTMLASILELRVNFREMALRWRSDVLSHEIVLSSYFDTLKMQNKDVGDVLNSAVRILHGVPSCSTSGQLSRCLKDVSGISAEDGQLSISMIFEEARLQQSIKFCCVPTKSGLSEKNNKLLLKTTVDQKVGLLSNGKSFKLVNDTDLQFSDNYDELVHKSGCQLNFCGDIVLLSCSYTSTITDANNGVQKVDPFKMVKLSFENFPITLNSEIIHYENLREHFGSVKDNIIINSVNNNQQYSPFSLNTIVRKQAASKITEGKNLLHLIWHYGPMRQYFIASVAVFATIVILIILGLCIKYRKFVSKLTTSLCGVCGWSPCCDSVDTSSDTTPAEEGMELLDRQAPKSVDASTYVRTVDSGPPPY